MSERKGPQWSKIVIVAAIMATAVAYVTTRNGDPKGEVPANTPEVAPPSYDVWTRDDAGKYVTHRITEAQTGFADKTPRDGLWVTTDGREWQARIDEKTLRVCDCEAHMKKPEYFDKPCTTFVESGKTRSLSLITEGEIARIVESETEVNKSDEDNTADYDHSVDVIGIIGDQILYTDMVAVYYCGAAHGTYGTTYHAYDMRARKPIDWATWPETVQAAAELRAQAFTELKAKETFAEKAEDVSVTAVLPRFDPARGLVVEYQFTGDACYACSDGWTAYTSSTQIASALIPSAWDPFVAMPEPVRAFAAKNPKDVLLGWVKNAP